MTFGAGLGGTVGEGAPGKCSSDILQSSDDDRGQIAEAEKAAAGAAPESTRTPTLVSTEEADDENDEAPGRRRSRLARRSRRVTFSASCWPSLSTRYYQILLSQGGGSTAGNGLAVDGLEPRRRSPSLLIFGGLLRSGGYGWAMRACGFVILAALAVANATVRARGLRRRRRAGLSSSPSASTSPSPSPTWRPPASAPACVKELAQNLITFYNAGSLVGRLGSGILSDRAGKFNVFTVACSTAGVLVLVMWIPAATVAFAVLLFGIFSGAYISLLASLVAQISLRDEFGYRNGLMLFVSSVGGPTTSPVAGAILDGPGGWVGLKAFAGVMLLAGTLATFLARFLARLSETGFRLRAVF
ncbi:hypothetical protein F5X99DRAFT_406389 [Biscogniauxia marginata]|nr:hypothetical protein F5X99DRAFT_406389 [Biscogniauxia marginata]